MFDAIWMKANYPSDINREQFEQICSLLENALKKTTLRKEDLYEAFYAALCLRSSGSICTNLSCWMSLAFSSHSYREWREDRKQALGAITSEDFELVLRDMRCYDNQRRWKGNPPPCRLQEPEVLKVVQQVRRHGRVADVVMERIVGQEPAFEEAVRRDPAQC
jgi:hypothetical protein